ncbi:MAG: DedA family protein [Arthrobacter sp.]|uniref:DedA family protein n=1 Tax=unclassified Arthrobacter TaxID=235627 RepID=UPI002651CCB7|nr:VTT domain-containing protein [Micrococcaceae bacterium]MDN6298870.1 VTT domain-containing protein [Micrococcaceae bacterium]
MNEVGEGLRSLDGTWVYLFGAVMVALSALIPPVPSTTLYVALGALAAQTDTLNPLLLAASMLVGAIAGDAAIYALAVRFDVVNWRILAGRRWQAALAATRNRLKDHDLPLVMTSRFIPMGRLTMNIGSALVPHTWRVFLQHSLIAGVLWSVYSVGVGLLSGAWDGLSTEVAVLLAIVVSLVLGRAINNVISWWETRNLPAPTVAGKSKLRRRAVKRAASAQEAPAENPVSEA